MGKEGPYHDPPLSIAFSAGSPHTHTNTITDTHTQAWAITRCSFNGLDA